MIIAIDGVAASGKSTIARMLASKLDAFYINSGLLYRAVAYILSQEYQTVEYAAAHLTDETLHQLYKEYDVCYTLKDFVPSVYVKKIDVTIIIKSAAIDAIISSVASILLVRSFVTKLQQQLAYNHPTIVIEGRDTTTHVFPQADFKFFITASLQVRAQRWTMLQQKNGFSCDIQKAKELIAFRDQQDKTRVIGSLIRPADAIIIDTSLEEPQVIVNNILTIIKNKKQ